MITMQEASEKLLEMFKSQEFGPQLSLSIIKRRSDDPVNALPCNKWSIGNRMLMYFLGHTDAAATFLQWKAMHRRVVKNAKAFPIYSPITSKIKKKKDDGTEEEFVLVRGFRPVSVFRIKKNKYILDWISEMAAMTQPSEIVWIDGSEEHTLADGKTQQA